MPPWIGSTAAGHALRSGRAAAHRSIGPSPDPSPGGCRERVGRAGARCSRPSPAPRGRPARRAQHVDERRAGRSAPASGNRCRPRTARASGVEEHGERPAALLAQAMQRAHVDRVDVGPLLAVDLDVDEQLVHHRRRRVVLEALVRHDVAPVAGGIADRQQDRLAVALRLGQRLRAPGPPVDGIFLVLQQVGARLPPRRFSLMLRVLRLALGPVSGKSRVTPLRSGETVHSEKTLCLGETSHDQYPRANHLCPGQRARPRRGRRCADLRFGSRSG